MKSTSKLLYAIGFVFNVIDLFLLTIVVILCGVAIASSEIIAQVAAETSQTVELVQKILMVLIIVCSVIFIVHFALIFVVLSARKNLNNNTGKYSPHVILLLVGIFDFNLFYLLGGIFGSVAAGESEE